MDRGPRGQCLLSICHPLAEGWIAKNAPAGDSIQGKVRHDGIQLLVDKDRSVEDDWGDAQTPQMVSGQLEGRRRLEMAIWGYNAL